MKYGNANMMMVSIMMTKMMMMMTIEQLWRQGKIIIKLSTQQIEEWLARELEAAQAIGRTEYMLHHYSITA